MIQTIFMKYLTKIYSNFKRIRQNPVIFIKLDSSNLLKEMFINFILKMILVN